jgi:type IV pilus assembly protein PilE
MSIAAQGQPARSAGAACRTLRQCGLTLVELLSGITLLAIAVAIGVPAYRSHMLRTERRDATEALLAVQAAQDRFLLQHGRYCERLTAAPPAGLGMAGRSRLGFYAIGVRVNADASTYLARAVPIASSSVAQGTHTARPRDATCRSFSIDQNGLKSAQDDSGADSTRDCWP